MLCSILVCVIPVICVSHYANSFGLTEYNAIDQEIHNALDPNDLEKSESDIGMFDYKWDHCLCGSRHFELFSKSQSNQKSGVT